MCAIRGSPLQLNKEEHCTEKITCHSSEKADKAFFSSSVVKRITFTSVVHLLDASVPESLKQGSQRVCKQPAFPLCFVISIWECLSDPYLQAHLSGNYLQLKLCCVFFIYICSNQSNISWMLTFRITVTGHRWQDGHQSAATERTPWR